MADVHWQCQLNHLAEGETAGAALGTDPITVGEKFLLKCEGDEVQFNPAQLSLELPQEQQYQLKLLKNLGVDSHKASFVATSYVAGEKPAEFKNIFLSDGKSRVALDGVSFTVKTVITQQNNPKHEPFGPTGSFGVSYPLWFWLSFAFVFVFFIAHGVEKIFEALERKKFFKKLSAHPPAISAYHQLTKELRQFNREHLRPQSFDADIAAKFLRDLDNSVRWYLSRTFEFSCFDIRSSEILMKLKKKNFDLEKKINHSLSRVLVEIDRLKGRFGLLKFDDAVQLIEMVRVAADEIQKNIGTKAGNKISREKLEAEV